MDSTQINILGVRVNPLQVPQLHQLIQSIIEENTHALILNVNVNCLNLAYQHRWLKDFLNSAEIVFCDGAGVVLGAKILGYHIPQRITYADWMWELAAFAEFYGYSIYLLGGKPGVADLAADKLINIYPRLNICGTFHGYFDKTQGSIENQEMVAQINRAKPNILVTSFGMPLQERWLLENWEKLNANIALTGGAALDYVSGTVKRAPKWITNHSMEWFGRLYLEPKRLWKRYIIGNPLFLYRILLQKFGLLRV